jgi:Protein of unknown function (DUF3810)
MITGAWLLLIITTILIKFASTQSLWVEENFSTNIYPVVSEIQRSIFGWIPFSVGDLFYSFLILVIIFKSVQLIKTVYYRKFTRQYLLTGLKQLIFFFLFVYVFFYGLWGLNYSRQGIAYKLGLEVKPYNIRDIDTITGLLQQRLNFYAETVNLKSRDTFNRKKVLFEKSTEAYLYAANQYPFLSYTPQSIKPSVFSYLGNFLGFQGYYNPFTGEGQVNTTIPRVIEPFVSAHEIAHQIGYAKENEANFVAFLACRSYPSEVFRYSMYFDMYNYASNELFREDSVRAKAYNEKLHPQVLQDKKEYKAFFKKYKNPVEPVIMWLYGNYLQANNQPDGKRTYNNVVAFLIAYYKKYGAEAL